MEKPRIEQVLQVIDALYSTQNAGGKEDASKWLEGLQNSVRNFFKFCIGKCCSATWVVAM